MQSAENDKEIVVHSILFFLLKTGSLDNAIEEFSLA